MLCKYRTHDKMLRSKLPAGFRLLIYQKWPNRLCSTQGSTDEEKQKELDRIKETASIDNPPTTCCQSGCANCVYIAWAEALSAKLKNAGPEVAEKIINLVDDPNMKAYLEMELRLRGLKK